MGIFAPALTRTLSRSKRVTSSKSKVPGVALFDFAKQYGKLVRLHATAQFQIGGRRTFRLPLDAQHTRWFTSKEPHPRSICLLQSDDWPHFWEPSGVKQDKKSFCSQ